MRAFVYYETHAPELLYADGFLIKRLLPSSVKWWSPIAMGLGSTSSEGLMISLLARIAYVSSRSWYLVVRTTSTVRG